MPVKLTAHQRREHPGGSRRALCRPIWPAVMGIAGGYQSIAAPSSRPTGISDPVEFLEYLLDRLSNVKRSHPRFRQNLPLLPLPGRLLSGRQRW